MGGARVELERARHLGYSVSRCRANAPYRKATMSDESSSTHDERVEEHLEAAAEEEQAAHESAEEVASEVVEEVADAAEEAQEAAQEAQETAQEAAETIEEEVRDAAEENGIDYDRLASHVADKLQERGHTVMGAVPDAATEVASPVEDVVTDPIRPTSEHFYFRPWKRFLRP